MSKLDEYVAKRGKGDLNFVNLVEQEIINLDIAVKVRNLRENMGISQRCFADLVGKPQSTIARIENGTMNVSTKTLLDIAQATDQRLVIQFAPVF